jgi:glutamyl-tRNA synthetase
LVKEKGYDVSMDFLTGVCRLMKERASFMPEIVENGSYFFERPKAYGEKTVSKKWKEETPAVMESLALIFNGVNDFDASNLEQAFKSFLEEQSLGMGAVLPNLRLIVTGEGMGPGMFDIMELLGKSETLERMALGIKTLSNAAN